MRLPLVLASLIAIAGTPAAARPSFDYAVVVVGPSTLESVLRQQLRDGFTCAAVARPVGMDVAQTVAVVLTRDPAASPAAAADVRVLTSTPRSVGDLDRELDAAAAQGFGLCGLTLTTPIWGRPGGAFAVVAVLTRTTATPTGIAYRAIFTTGRRDEWALVQKAAADGYAVTRLVSRPQTNVNSTSDIVFLTEKTATSRPLTYDLVLAGNGPALQKDVDKSTKKGFCVQATWASLEWMTVLLSKPIDAPCDRPHEYEVEDGSAFMGLRVSSTDGALLGLHRVKDSHLALYDGKDRALEYSVVEGVLVDEDVHRARLTREHRQLIDKLDADGDRGYRPLDVAWRAGPGNGTRAIDVILARPRE